MDTPIFDFLSVYSREKALRLHMPGHKGYGEMGVEVFDLTEIDGADSLYEASGIIAKSEKNASLLFGCPTFYSTEGSSLCVRAMLYLCYKYACKKGRKQLIFAGRNCHKTFISGVAALDISVEWLYGDDSEGYLSCLISPEKLDEKLANSNSLPIAVYLTSPDYLGNIINIKKISAVCHKYGVLLIVDCAHGSYLKFLEESQFPIDLGADMCCTSAHKTLPVLTGGAYLHLSSEIYKLFKDDVKESLAFWGSTSPSYLIMASLDLANKTLADGYANKLNGFIKEIDNLKKDLQNHGYNLIGEEKLKITVDARAYGYTGYELAEILHKKSIVCEFSDPDYVVMMLSMEIDLDGLKHVREALYSVERKEYAVAPKFSCLKPIKVETIRNAVLSESEIIQVEKSAGRILAGLTVGCPPAVPIVVCGELIDEKAIEIFNYYGIKTCKVIKKSLDL